MFSRDSFMDDSYHTWYIHKNHWKPSIDLAISRAESVGYCTQKLILDWYRAKSLQSIVPTPVIQSNRFIFCTEHDSIIAVLCEE